MIDDSLRRRMVLAAGVLGVIGVSLGAMGAHGLEGFLVELNYGTELGPELIEKRLQQFDTGVRYHMYHTIAILALAGIPLGSPTMLRWVGRLMIAGIVLFSGSLYLLTVTNQTKFGMITPLGGLSWIIAWAGLVVMVFRHNQQTVNG